MTMDKDLVIAYIGGMFMLLNTKSLEATMKGRITHEEYGKVTAKMTELLDYLEKNLK